MNEAAEPPRVSSSLSRSSTCGYDVFQRLVSVLSNTPHHPVTAISPLPQDETNDEDIPVWQLLEVLLRQRRGGDSPISLGTITLSRYVPNSNVTPLRLLEHKLSQN